MMCLNMGPGALFPPACTLPSGHQGPHVAEGKDGAVVAVWARTDETEPEPPRPWVKWAIVGFLWLVLAWTVVWACLVVAGVIPS